MGGPPFGKHFSPHLLEQTVEEGAHAGLLARDTRGQGHLPVSRRGAALPRGDFPGVNLFVGAPHLQLGAWLERPLGRFRRSRQPGACPARSQRLPRAHQIERRKHLDEDSAAPRGQKRPQTAQAFENDQRDTKATQPYYTTQGGLGQPWAAHRKHI